jgi:hypothetical protein
VLLGGYFHSKISENWQISKAHPLLWEFLDGYLARNWFFLTFGLLG